MSEHWEISGSVTEVLSKLSQVALLMAMVSAWAQTALAQSRQQAHIPAWAKMPACRWDNGSLINDASWRLTPESKAELQRLISHLEKGLHHQLAVYNIGTLKDSGFATTHDLANALWRKCEIGFRGADTGIVFLSTSAEVAGNGKVMKLGEVWVEVARPEAYLPDGLISSFLEEAKKSCKAWDIACIVQHLAKSIEWAIQKEFDARGIQWLKDKTLGVDIENFKKHVVPILIIVWWIICITLIWLWKRRRRRLAWDIADAAVDVAIYMPSPGPTRVPINLPGGGEGWSGAWAGTTIWDIVADTWVANSWIFDMMYSAATSVWDLGIDAVMGLPEVVGLFGEWVTLVVANVDGETVVNVISGTWQVLGHIVGWIFTAALDS